MSTTGASAASSGGATGYLHGIMKNNEFVVAENS